MYSFFEADFWLLQKNYSGDFEIISGKNQNIIYKVIFAMAKDRSSCSFFRFDTFFVETRDLNDDVL